MMWFEKAIYDLEKAYGPSGDAWNVSSVLNALRTANHSPGTLKLVIIESPYAGDIETHTGYARACLRDSLNRGEAPIASHILYTQEGVLQDHIDEERQWGIAAGLAWRKVAELAAFYTDHGWSDGMLEAKLIYEAEGKPYEIRTLSG